MTKIIIASKNPVKVAAALEGFRRMFPERDFEIEGVSVPSRVSEQPLTDAETLQGATNRAESASQSYPQADFWVGIEGGVEKKNGEMLAFAWVVIHAKDAKIGKGRTGTFFLPQKIVELIDLGKELGEADDIVFGQVNSKQNNGAVGFLTGNVIDRTKYYVEAVILALIPFKNDGLY